MQHGRFSSVFWGILIVALGIILMMNNFGVTDVDLGYLISVFWPLILVFWGVRLLLFDNKSGKSKGNLILGIIVLLLGFSILGQNTDFYSLDLSLLWKILWPLLLIIIGINIFRASIKPGTEGSSWAVMSGSSRKNPGWQLKNESFVAVMGGIELDLTTASIPDEEIVLDMTAIMGGIEVKAPEGLNITCKSSALLGGVTFFKDQCGGIVNNREFQHPGSGEGYEGKKITITCRAVMGGIEIKGS